MVVMKVGLCFECGGGDMRATGAVLADRDERRGEMDGEGVCVLAQ